MVETTSTVRVARALVAGAVLAVLAACAVGPDYRRPEAPLPDRYATDPARVARAATEAAPVAVATI